LDPWNTWSYDLTSWASLFNYEPKIPANKNEKPVLVSSGAKDTSFPKAVMKMTADAISGPVEFYCLEEGTHQLMLFHTEEYSKVVHDWALRQL
jgi:pimeloyl-ACP methyl ester carboxylesterase